MDVPYEYSGATFCGIPVRKRKASPNAEAGAEGGKNKVVIDGRGSVKVMK